MADKMGCLVLAKHLIGKLKLVVYTLEKYYNIFRGVICFLRKC